MSIRVVCSNGHTLNVKEKYAGKTGLCPKCKVHVDVPRRAISDSSIIAILGDHAGAAPAGKVSPAANVKTTCPRCHSHLSKDSRACPHCHLYLPLTWQKHAS